MRLIEASSKQLLGTYGLAAPPGRLCATADEARSAAEGLGGEVYVKAQIPFGDRASLGLVTPAAGPREAAEAARELLGRSVDGQTVASVLVEASAAPEQTAYLSVHVDDELRARVLRIGLGGGAGYRPEDAQIQEPVPVRGLESYEVRRLVGRTGLTGAHREALTRAAMAVLRAAREWHAYTVEVNPLFLTDASAVAIDAKAELDPYSLKAVPDPSLLPEHAESARERGARQFQESDHRGSFRFVQLIEDAEPDGDAPVVGSHSVGGGESLVVFDALDAVGLRPANYCDTSGAPSREKVAFAAELIAAQPHIDGFFFSSCIANQPLSVTAGGLVDGFEAAGWRGPTVVRIAGNEEEQAREIVQAWADEQDVPAIVVGREVDEWDAARLLADDIARRKG
jgi:succinyl-CoA synthetase beta subunit